MTEFRNIPLLFRALVAKVSLYLNDEEREDPFPVYWFHGRYLEVDKILTSMGQAVAKSKQRYPLVWLRVPYTKYFPALGDVELRGVELVIATQSRPDSTTPDRYEANYVTRLWPIYERLMKAIKDSGYFVDLGEHVPHTATEQPYWDGKERGTQEANLFGDYVDVIHVKLGSIKVNKNACEEVSAVPT